MDGANLSQEEINALLNASNTSSPKEEVEYLTPEEKDAVGEISNISMGTAATALFTLVNNKVTITTPKVSYANWDDLINEYDRPCVFIQISYKEGISGNNVLILKEKDVKIITDLMMGGDGTNTSDELSELHLSAISEAMNQMMGSSATSLSQMLNRKVDISPPIANLIDLNDVVDEEYLDEFLSDTFVKVAFKMEIGTLVDSQIMQLYPMDFAKSLFRIFNGAMSGGESEPEKPVEQSAPQQAPSQPQGNVQQQPYQDPNAMQMGGYPQQPYQDPNAMQMGGYPQQPYQDPNAMQMGGYPQQPYQNPNAMQMGGYPQQPYGYGVYPMGVMPQMQNMNAQPVQFQAFQQAPNPAVQQENIDLIRDVPLEVTVELGRTNKSIKEILEFTQGTIIELNRLAGEPVDVLVNGKIVAKGEVVVIEESFGVRIKDIIK